MQMNANDGNVMEKAYIQIQSNTWKYMENHGNTFRTYQTYTAVLSGMFRAHPFYFQLPAQ